MRANRKEKYMCSFDLVVEVKELNASYSEYSESLDLGGYFWVDQQITEASGFGYTSKQWFE